MRIIILLIFLGLSACLSSGEAPTPDGVGLTESFADAATGEPTPTTEPMSDASGPEQLPEPSPALCQKAIDEWQALRPTAETCSEGDTCVYFGFQGGCNCGYGIAGVGPGGVGAAINTKYSKEADRIEQRYFHHCGKQCTFDLIPYAAGGCVNGRCVLSKPAVGCQSTHPEP